jgi:diguanylate cyclase
MGFEGARDQGGKRDVDMRQKYLDAIAQLEAGEARWSQLETTLKRVIGRLCLAARGRAEPLDTELRRVSDLVRGRGDLSAIEASLEPLTRAIASLDEGSMESSGATTTSRALSLGGYVPQPPVETTITSRRIEPTLTMPVPPPQGIDLEDEESKVRALIEAVLDRLSRLPELRPALSELVRRSKESIGPEEFAAGLERVARLISEQRTGLVRERKEVEDLLQQMDSRLAEIAGYLASDSADQKSAQASTQQFDLMLTNEVRNLTDEMHNAQDLGSLRSRVQGRLEIITHHLQDFRLRESARVAAQLDRTQRMRVRVTALEQEIHGLHKSLQEEQSLRLVDALTGIPNRASYDDRVRLEFMRWQRDNSPVSILAWDIDHFKEINDTYGHTAGDKVLKVIAQYLAQQVRGTDFVARYGGEEFAMVLIGTDAAQALVAADKIRLGVQNIGFHFHNKPVTVTASCGIAAFRNEDTPESVFDRADRALYRAKDGGRNCCRVL